MSLARVPFHFLALVIYEVLNASLCKALIFRFWFDLLITIAKAVFHNFALISFVENVKPLFISESSWIKKMSCFGRFNMKCPSSPFATSPLFLHTNPCSSDSPLLFYTSCCFLFNVVSSVEHVRLCYCLV